MTIGLGMLCPEGAVLATDSMRIWGTVQGDYSVPGLRRPGWIASRICVVASGRHCPLDRLCPDISQADFVPAVRNLFDRLVELDKEGEAQWDDPELWRKLVSDSGEAPQLLAVGGPAGEFPRFASLAPSGGQWYGGPGPSAVHAVGIWLPWLKERGRLTPPLPDSLDGWRRLVLSLTVDFLRWLYQGKTFDQWCNEGISVGAGWPLNLVTFDRHGAHRQELVTEEEALRELALVPA
jgi:hypothetical protein